MKVFKNVVGVLVVGISLFIACINVNAAEMSAEFKSHLNKDGKFEFNSVVPIDELYFGLMVDRVTYDENQNWNGLQFNNVSADYSEVDLTINRYEENEETHRIKLQWNYDEVANKKIKDFVNNSLKNKTEFNVYDLELVNYWVNLIRNNDRAELIMFSGELKQLLNYGNIEFDIRIGGGGYAPFISEAIGFAYFGYNGSVYHTIPVFGATGKHILYVADETVNTPEAIEKAAQKRINDYLGDNDIEVDFVSTALDYLSGVNISSYVSFDKAFEYEMGLDGVNEDDLIFEVTIPIDENMGDSKFVIIRRDSSKMVNPTSRTADLSTNIEISTSNTIPLDTIIQAKELNSGSEYEKIVKILNLTDNLTFDLKLYSNSIDKYISKLDNGEFEVSIPIPEDFKGKDLVVYYVDENEKKESFEVDLTSKPGYAIFKTTHFSIYTLGYKETDVKVTFDANGGVFGKESAYTIDNWNFNMYDNLKIPTREGYKFIGYFTEKTGGTKFEMILNEAGIDNNSIYYAQWEKVEEVPKTFDKSGLSIIIASLSLLSLVGASLYLKKEMSK